MFAGSWQRRKIPLLASSLAQNSTYLEVPVFGFGDQVRGGLARSLVGDDRAVLDAPVGLTDAVPLAADRFAVERRDPARTGLTRGPRRDIEGDGGDDEPGGNSDGA
jgi:hypothetical protein